jgi:hypothetical protein
MTAMKTMACVTVLAMAASGLAQTTVHHSTSTVTSVGTGQGEGVGFGAGAQSTPAAKDDLFAGTEIFAKNATDVTEINMDSDSLAMVRGKDKDKAQNMMLNVVRTYEYDKPGMYNMSDVDKFRERLSTGDWRCTVHTRNMKTGESTDVCNKRRTDDLYETAIITVEPKELTFIHMISHHAPMIGMPGMGEMGMFPGTLGSLKSLAMLDPEMLEMRMEMNELKGGMNFRMAPMAPMAPMQVFDGEAFGKAFGKAFDEKDWEKAAKDWEKSGMKVKEFTSPDGKKTIIISPNSSDSPVWTIAPDAPVTPDAPEAVPAMPAPAAPAAPASPATPKAEAAPVAPQAIPTAQL